MGLIKKYKKIEDGIYWIYTRQYLFFWKHTGIASTEKTAKLVCKCWYK